MNPWRRRPRGRRATGSQGAALVEFALVVPVLAALLLGTIEFGKGYNDYQSLRQGVREAARGGAVDNYRGVTASSSCSQASNPEPVRRLTCLTVREADIGSDLRVRVRYTAPDSSDSTDRGAVKVCAQRGFQPITGFIPGLSSITLKSEIEMRMEKDIPSGITAGTNYGDTGGDWGWC